MALFDIFSRRRRPLDGGNEPEVSPVGGELGANDAVRRKQRMLLASAAGIGLVLSSFWIFSGDGGKHAPDPDGAGKVEVSTGDLVNRNLSNQEWMALSENRFQSTENQLKAVNGESARVDQLASQVEALKSQNQSMQNDGQRVLSAYQSENEQLRRQLSDKATNPPPTPGPSSLYGANGVAAYQRPDGASAPAATDATMHGAEVKMVSFPAADTGTASKIGKGSTVYTDSPNYLPPNSIAKATVIVGVDAGAGVQSQTDPLPVVLRVTGPARSVFQDGRLLTTKIEGCLVNGAARGDLSSEKVYVKLQKMTCPQPGGRYAVSEVKGFLAFGGKTGVRGHVVSREGGLVTQAFLAGLVGGFGRGFSTNAESFLTQPSVTVAGQRPKLGLGDIAQGGIGEGVSQSGDTVSRYLIERAEQYQPVIEMPTGVNVEIVFLEGVYVRN